MQSRFGDSMTGWAAFGLAICLCFYPVPARSLPAGGTVTAGDATIAQPNPTTLNINQTSNKAIINWKGFNINVNELVKFSQPGSSSVVLNRVVGVDPSSILGHLVANGRVFLVNSNGIYFGPNSVVNAAGVFATTLGIKDSDFLAGKYTFSQDPSKNPSYVINQGQIKVSDDGFVFLVAPGVKNENLIVANLGKVVLASGQQFTVDFLGDGLINFIVEGKVLDRVIGPDGNPLSSAVSNSGTIKADGGQVTLSARASKDIFESVVNNSGVIEAKSLVNRGGVIRLEGSDPVENTGQIGWQANLGKVQNAEGAVINTGTLDVSAAEAGAAQGQVTLSGESVGVSGTILARGADNAQGGKVLITSTEKTELTSTSLIDTSGVGNSSAGNVVVWSDNDTIFSGTILGRGGEFGGDGGNVEVSGYNHLTVTGSVDLSAPNGVTGTLLLDPGTVTICHDTDSESCSFDRGPNTFSDSYINRQLALSDLTISTSNANNEGLEDITFQDTQIAIAWRNSNILTLNAGRNISVLGSITAGPGGTVLFQFGQAGAGGTLDFNDATVPTFNFRGGAGADTVNFSRMPSPVSIVFPNSGDVENWLGNGGTLTAVSQPNLFWTITGPNAGNVNDGVSTFAFTNFINLTGGNLNDSFILAGGSLSGAINGGAGNNTLTGGNVANTWNITGGNSGTVTGVSGGFTNIQNLTGGTNLDNFVFGASGSISGLIDGNVGVDSVNYSALSTPVTVIGGTNVLNVEQLTTTGALTVGGSFTGSLETHSGPLTFAATTVGGNLSSFANGPVTQTGPLTVAGTTLMIAGTNPITLANASNDFQGAVTTTGSNISLVDANGLIVALAASGAGTLIAGGNLAVSGSTGSTLTTMTTGSGATSFGVTSVGSNLTTTSAGGVSQTGAITVTGNADFTGASISLANDANNFGTLTFNSPGAVIIRENSAIVISGTNTANSLILTSTAGAITDVPGTSLTVTNNANFSGTSIDLGNQPGDTMNFGSLTFNSQGGVKITEDSDTFLVGANEVESLVLASAGSITDDPNMSLTVSGNATFSGTSAKLGSIIQIGSVTFVFSGSFELSAVSAIVIEGRNIAGSLQLASQVLIDANPGSSIELSDLIVKVIAPDLGQGFFNSLPPGAIVINDSVFSNPGVDSVFGLLEKKLVTITTEELALVPPDILQLDDELKRRLQITEGFSDMRYTLAAIILNFQPSIMKSPVVNILVRAPAWGPAVTSEEFESLSSGSRFGLGSMGLTF